jgi:hypothetical protein
METRLSMRRARLIYSAAVRPAMMYGAQIWGTQDGKAVKASVMQPMKMVQNKCLGRITGGYKRTPMAALERVADIQLPDLYMEIGHHCSLKAPQTIRSTGI